MPSASLGEAYPGLAYRLRGDAALVALIGYDAADEPRAVAGWPEGVLQNPERFEYPFVSFLRVAPGSGPQRQGTGAVRFQLDMWGWELADVELVDARVMALLDEQWWVYTSPAGATARLDAVAIGGAGGGRDWPGRPWRRTRDFDIGVR